MRCRTFWEIAPDEGEEIPEIALFELKIALHIGFAKSESRF